MKLGTAAFLLLTTSDVSADHCKDKCNDTFSRSITQILTSCVEACEAGGQVCDDFCEQYVSDTEQCEAIFCEGQNVEKKTNLRAGIESPSDQEQDVDVGILGSKDVSFVADAVQANSHDDSCFRQCLRRGGGNIQDFYYCADICSPSQDNRDENKGILRSEDVAFVSDTEGVNSHGDDCFDQCIGSSNNIYAYWSCAFYCYYFQDGKDENMRDASFISDSVGVNHHDIDECIDGCLGSTRDIYGYFFCSFLCSRFRDSKDEDKSSLMLNKVDIQEKSQYVPGPCVRGCRGDLDCIARCYGSPSYCHYSCFDETNSDESYRQCVSANNCDGLKSFAKKMSKYN